MLDRSVILPHVIAARAAKTPDQEFVYDLTAGKTFTCAGLHRDILRWAAAYQRAGVGEGDHVVTMLPGDSTATQAWLGLSWLIGRSITRPLMGLAGAMTRLANGDVSARIPATTSSGIFSPGPTTVKTSMQKTLSTSFATSFSVRRMPRS